MRLNIYKLSVAVLFSILIGNSFTCDSSLLPKDIISTEYGLTGRIDRYGDKWINSESITEENLSHFLATNLRKEDGKAFLTTVPILQASQIIPILEKLGFKFFAHTKNGFEYYIKNDSPIPSPLTSVEGAQGILLRTTALGEEVLIIQEETKAGFVGGAQDPHELIRDTMLRETEEEIGLGKDQVKIDYLLAIRSRIKANHYGANHNNFYYILRTNKPDVELKLQPGEILGAHWVLVKDVLNRDWNLLALPSEFYLLLDHYYNHRHDSKFIEMPDFRQHGNQPPDDKDVMHYEIFAKPK